MSFQFEKIAVQFEEIALAVSYFSEILKFDCFIPVRFATIIGSRSMWMQRVDGQVIYLYETYRSPIEAKIFVPSVDKVLVETADWFLERSIPIKTYRYKNGTAKMLIFGLLKSDILIFPRSLDLTIL